MKSKKHIMLLLKLSIFIVVANIPFLSVVNIMGLEPFVDSFENPEEYICIQNQNNFLNTVSSDNNYVIIQKSTHPNFKIKNNDEIIYFKGDGEIQCSLVKSCTSIGSMKTYYTVENNAQNTPVNEKQIIGKIINSVDNNILNSMSIKIWDISIHKLNVNDITN